MPLKPGQTSTEHINALEAFIREQIGEDGVYTRFPDPISLARYGCKASHPPVEMPRFTLVVDTAENYRFLVQKFRSMNWWTVATSMKRPPGVAYNPNFYAGDFAGLQWHNSGDAGDDVADEDESADYYTPRGYEVLWDAERKSISDAIAAFSDGRREQQRAEHAASSAKRHVFILEGDPDDVPPTRRRWVSILNTDLDHLVIDSPFVVRQIRSYADLVPTLANFMAYTARGIVESERGIKKYVHHTFSGKAGPRVVDTPDALLSGMLQAVPGVSPAAAQAIRDNAFKTTVDLARAIVSASESSEAREALIQTLANIPVPAQSACQRKTTRLGVRGQRIVDLMVPVSGKHRAPDDKKREISDDDDEPVMPRRKKAEPSKSSDDLWDYD